MLCVTLESLMPEQHFLRDLDRLVDFDFIYEKVDALYSHTGRPSIDPSECRLEREVQVNLAFRWFLGIDLDEPVPDHSTFSQLRRRKFNGTNLRREIWHDHRCVGDAGQRQRSEFPFAKNPIPNRQIRFSDRGGLCG